MTLEAKKAYQKAYYQKNKDRIKEAARKHYHENRERHNETSKRWNRENQDRVRANRKAWYERNRDKVLARQKEWGKTQRFTQHGMTEDDYLALLEKQQGVCAICRRECDVIDTLSIDHCHETGHVRGLLCKRCNSGLGFFRDDWRLLLTATRYVEFRTLERKKAA